MNNVVKTWGLPVYAIMITLFGVFGQIAAHREALGPDLFYWLLRAWLLFAAIGGLWLTWLLCWMLMWLWRWGRKKCRSEVREGKTHRDASGKPLCPEEETFSALARDWEHHARHGELGFSRHRLDRFREWPMIQELSCQLFNMSAFTNDTYNRLEAWLLTHHVNGDQDEMLCMSQAEVVRLLREALDENT